MLHNQNFGQVVAALNQGRTVSRAGWNGKGMVVFRQVPSEVPADIIPRMTSLPPDVKKLIEGRGKPLRYSNQLAILDAENNVNGWTPNTSDALSTDWIIYGEEVCDPAPEGFTVARETVGTAKPLE